MYKLHKDHAFAIPMVLTILLLTTIMSLGFFYASGNKVKEAGAVRSRVASEFELKAALEEIKVDLREALDGIQAQAGSFSDVLAEIRNDPDLTRLERSKVFLETMILARLASSAGVPVESLGVWVPDSNRFEGRWFRSSDIPTLELKYNLTALPVRFSDQPAFYGFEYEWQIESRTTPNGERTPDFVYLKASETNMISIEYRPTPLSRWAVFRMTSRAGYNGDVLWFVGPRYQPGHSGYIPGEVFDGPVYLGDTTHRAIFAGNVIFRDRLDMRVPYELRSVSGYGGTPNHPQYSFSAPAMELPQNFYSLERIALGHSGDLSELNDQPLTNLAYRFLAASSVHQPMLDQIDAPLPEGVYIPMHYVNGVPRLKGGVYTQGNVQKMRLKVTDRASIATEHNEFFLHTNFLTDCPLQQVEIQNSDEKFTLYSSDRRCSDSVKTLIVTEYSDDRDPVYGLYLGAPNKLIYVNGEVESLGQESRQDRALQRDRQLTIAAKSHIKISNDLTYEDAEYHELRADGTMSEGPISDPSIQGARPRISPESETLLGIISTNGRILLKCQTNTCADPNPNQPNAPEALNVPSNINLHAALFASSASSTDCPAPNINNAQPGCGFGFEGMLNVNSHTVANKGVIKFLGAMSEYRNFAVGLGAEGFKRAYTFDRRLLEMAPPFFPMSDVQEANVTINIIGTLRFVQNTLDQNEAN